MLRHSKVKPGDVLLIPVDTDVWGYAQVLNDGDIRVFDLFTKEVESDLSKVLESATINRMIINVGLEKGVWKSIGNAPIPNEFKESRYYIRDASGPNLYKISSQQGMHTTRGHKKKDVIGLPHHGIWDTKTLEYRLNCYYHKRPDIYDAMDGKLDWVMK